MTDTYATVEELTDRLSSAYTVPADAEALLAKASELIDHATMGRAQTAWDSGYVEMRAFVSAATCDQVEYWLEVGEERDVVGNTGRISAGRWSLERQPPELAPRAKRQLMRGGMYWAGAKAF